MIREIGCFCLDGKSLFRLKLKAIRLGIWFKALREIDRALVEVTLRVTKKVQSPKLATALLAVATRLELFFRGSLPFAEGEVGFRLAGKISAIACQWGNSSAREWARDLSFARFLAVMHFNKSAGFGD